MGQGGLHLAAGQRPAPGDLVEHGEAFLLAAAEDQKKTAAEIDKTTVYLYEQFNKEALKQLRGECDARQVAGASLACVHGTGGTLSSAIAAHLALGLSLPEAVRAGHAYVRTALTAAAHVRTGAGSGPLNHGAAPRPMQLISL